MNILVTGGAGYIGSVLTEELLKEGHRITLMDNLQQGHRLAVSPEADFGLVDICDRKALDEAFQKLHVDAVVHMAAETIVEYSMTDPKKHFQSNVVGGINILEAMQKYHVDKIVFSSSVSVYGAPESIPIRENHPGKPVNAYGESKLIFERILEWFARAYQTKHITLRYFNAAGASPLLGEDHYPETHLIPNVLKDPFGGTRRTGGPPVLVADSSLIRREPGWSPRFADLGSIIRSTWLWMQKYMHGYNDKQCVS